MSIEEVKEKITRRNICRSTYDALSLLVEGCKSSQELAIQKDLSGKLLQKIDKIAYSKEYCTVRMGASRGAGHSTAVAKLAVELFDNVLFLSPNQSMSTRLQHKVARECFAQGIIGPSQTCNGWSETLGKIESGNKKYIFASTGSIRTARGYEFNAIIVDNASLIQKFEEADIYVELSPTMQNNKHKFFIFIQ